MFNIKGMFEDKRKTAQRSWLMNNAPLFSVIIVTYKRPSALKLCLDSLQKYSGHFSGQIIVVINGEDKESELLLEDWNCQVVILKKSKSPAQARNLAAHFAQNPWLLFLDDDIQIPASYFSVAHEIFKKYPTGLDIFGGPDHTPLEANQFEQALGLALSSPMATAHTFKRHQSKGDLEKGSESKFILCHLWIRREIFKTVNFDERFVRNEENVLLFNLARSKMLYSPELFVYHKRKAEFIKLFPAVFSSGAHRIKSFFLYPKSFNPVYLLPLLFLFYIASLTFIKADWFSFPLTVFMIVSLFYSFKRGGITLGPIVLSYQLFINVAYALGTAWGIIDNTFFRLSKRTSRQ